MTREPARKHLDGAIAVATEALDHLQRGSVVSVKYHEGGAMEVDNSGRVILKLEIEALDVPLRNKPAGQIAGVTRNDDLLAEAVQFTQPSPEPEARNATLIRSILMGVFLGATTLTIDRAVKKLIDAQDLLK